jgi:hypothetical protein
MRRVAAARGLDLHDVGAEPGESSSQTWPISSPTSMTRAGEHARRACRRIPHYQHILRALRIDLEGR